MSVITTDDGVPYMVFAFFVSRLRGSSQATGPVESLERANLNHAYGRGARGFRPYFSGRYAMRSAKNEPSHSSLSTMAAIAVPVNEGVRGPRAISVAVIVLGSMVATA